MPRKLDFPAILKSNDQGGFIALFPDVPEALTEAGSRAAALERARDSLAVAILGRMKDGAPPPSPSPAFGRPTVAVPMECAAKIAVIERWHGSRISESELAARIGRDQAAVRRILNPEHRTKIGPIEDALAAMGWHLVIDTRPALEAYRVGAGATTQDLIDHSQPQRARYSLQRSAGLDLQRKLADLADLRETSDR